MDDLVLLVIINDEIYLYYIFFSVDVVLLRGIYVD